MEQQVRSSIARAHMICSGTTERSVCTVRKGRKRGDDTGQRGAVVDYAGPQGHARDFILSV